MPQARLQKILAAAGIASRRKSEELITAGRVQVNGQIVTELGARADADQDTILVDGKPLSGPERKVYFLMHKPKGYVSTVSDPEGRPTVMDLIPKLDVRLFPVGRLDYISEGLLLLTNDGVLMQKLTHASSHVAKTYLVKVSGEPSEDGLTQLRRGIVLPPVHPHTTSGETLRRSSGDENRPVKTSPATVEKFREGDNPWFEVTITEGRYHQIRRMFEQIGHRVEKIKRVRYGPLSLDVEAGTVRPLTSAEVTALYLAASQRNKPAKAGRAEGGQQTRRERPAKAFARRPQKSFGGNKARFGRSDDEGRERTTGYGRPARGATRERFGDKSQSRDEQRPRRWEGKPEHGREDSRNDSRFSREDRSVSRERFGNKSRSRDEQRPRRWEGKAEHGREDGRKDNRFSREDRGSNRFDNRSHGRDERRPRQWEDRQDRTREEGRTSRHEGRPERPSYSRPQGPRGERFGSGGPKKRRDSEFRERREGFGTRNERGESRSERPPYSKPRSPRSDRFGSEQGERKERRFGEGKENFRPRADREPARGERKSRGDRFENRGRGPERGRSHEPRDNRGRDRGPRGKR